MSRPRVPAVVPGARRMWRYDYEGHTLEHPEAMGYQEGATITVTPTMLTIHNSVQDPSTEETHARGLAWLHAVLEYYFQDVIIDLGREPRGGVSCRELLDKKAVEWGLAHPRDARKDRAIRDILETELAQVENQLTRAGYSDGTGAELDLESLITLGDRKIPLLAKSGSTGKVLFY